MVVEWIVAVIAFLSQTIGVVVWGVRQEGRINVQEERLAALRDLINSRFDDADGRLERIERALNGRLRNV